MQERGQWGAEQLRVINAARTQHVCDAVKKALETMEAECKANGGLYPYNGGRLTQAEVCRRAGITPSTLRSRHHKLSTRVLITDWLARMLLSITTGGKAVRRKVTDRLDSLQAEKKALVAECVRANLQIDELKAQIEVLKTENATLAMRINGSA